MHDPSDSDSLSHQTVRAILEDNQGILWVGTESDGLSRFDPQTGEIIRYLHDPSDPDSISSNSLRTLYKDSLGRFWAGHYLGGRAGSV